MRVSGILALLLLAASASARPRTKDHEWTSGERAVRSEILEREVEAALVAALEEQQDEHPVLLTEEEPVFVKDEDQILSEVKPQDDDFVVPSYSPVGSENEYGNAETDTKLTPSLILDIEKRLQAEMGQMEGQLSLLHKLVASIFGPQVTLSPKEDFDPNVVVINVPQQQGGIGDHNPFTFGFDHFFNDNGDDNDDDDDEEEINPWFHDGPKFPSLSDVFGFPDSDNENSFGLPDFGDISNFGFSNNETDIGFQNLFGDLDDDWSNLPSNYSDSTHEIHNVNGSVIAVDETINKQSGEGYNFFSHKQVINVLPDEIESPIDSNVGTDDEIEVEAEKKTEETVENQGDNVNGEENIVDSEIMTINENELEEKMEDVSLVENLIESEFSEFPEFRMESENDIEDEEALFPNWRNWNSQEMEEFPFGETLDEGFSLNHEPLLLPSDHLVLPKESVFDRKYENEVFEHDLLDVISDQLVMPEKAAYYDIRSHPHADKNSVHNIESTYRDLSDDTRVNRVTANKSGMRMLEPHAEIFDYNRVLEESKPIQ